MVDSEFQGIRNMHWGTKATVFQPEPTEEELFADKVVGIYEEACKDPGFYYREAEEDGLVAVYKAGVAAGRSVTNVDFGPFIGDGDVFTVDGKFYKARFIEEDDDDPFLGACIRLVLVKE